MGWRLLKAGMSANAARNAKNMRPATTAMWYPEIESTWARPETYMASFTGAEMVSRLPVISADAIAPLSPGRTARIRLSMASRMPSMTAA